MLTMGRSLSEAREQPHRYKLRGRGLPTFGNGSAAVGKDFNTTVAPRLGGEVGQERAGGESMKSGTISGHLMPVPGNLFPAVRWGWKNPFKSTKRALRPVIQGELSLDNVKPLRNDLSDSDLELVRPVKRIEQEQNSVRVEAEDVPVVKARPILTRVRAMFQRAK